MERSTRVPSTLRRLVRNEACIVVTWRSLKVLLTYRVTNDVLPTLPSRWQTHKSDQEPQLWGEILDMGLPSPKSTTLNFADILAARME